MSGVTVDALVDRLRSAGVRITRPRRMTIEALVASGSHTTADDLLARLRADDPDFSPSTVYRTLDLLARNGIVHHVHLGHGPAEYHLFGDDHAHLVCDDCGVVLELPDAVGAQLARQVADAVDFHVDLGHFALTGRCARCEARR